MRNSSASALNTVDTFANLTAGSQVVYQNAAVDNTIIPASAGAVVFPLTSSFVYTGGSIEVGYDWDVSAFATNPTDGAFSWAYDTVGTIQARGTSAGSPLVPTATLTGTFTRRHQMQVTYTGGAVCTAPPVGGQTVANFPAACDGLPVSLTVTGDALGAGSSVQWQFSTDNVTYNNIAGATLPTYNFTYSAATDGFYQRVETCTAQTGTSTPVQVSAFIAVTNQVETFDNYLPTCWTEAQGLLGPTTTLAGTTSNWTADGFLNNGTTGSARIEIWTTSTDEWLISPTYNLTGNEQLVFDLGLTFWNTTAPAGTTGVDDKFAVIISTDNGATWSDANTLRLWDNAGSPNVYNDISNIGETVILDLSSYTGNVKFGFYGESTVSNADNNVYVDNLQVRTIPNCLDVTSTTFVSATANTANFTWESNNPNTSGLFEYLVDSMNSYPTGPDATVTPTGSFPIGNSSATTPIAQTGQVTGLTDATTYDLYIREVCSASDRSPWTSAVSFTTACIPVSAFSENFDAVSTPNLPTCWTSFNTVLATGTSPEVVTSTAADNSLPNGVALDSNSADGSTVPGDNILIAPEVANLSAGTHRLRFWLDASVSTSTLEVGTMTDPTNPSTFTVFTSIPATTTYTEHTVNFDTYTGTDTFIAFRHIFTTTFDLLYLDDIVWEAIPACQEPTGFAVASITDTTATLTWTNNNASTVSSIEYGAPGFAPGTGAGTVVAGMGNTATVTLLAPQTAYDFYVTQDCTASGDGLSIVIGPISASTACSPFMAPFTQDFENFNDTTNSTISDSCWTSSPAGSSSVTRWDVQNGAGGTPSITSGPTGPTGAFDGDSFVYLETSSGAAGNFADLTTPFVDLSNLNDPTLSFYYFMFGADISDLEIYINDGVNPPALVRTITGQQQAANTDPWIQEFVPLTAYANATISITFRGYRGASFAGDISLDAISVDEAPQCFDVSGVTASMITATGAQISWTENNTPAATAWEVVVLTAGTAAPVPGTTNATMTTFDATALTSSTTYDVYVRPDCATTFTGPVSFTTLAACGDTVYDTGGATGNYSANEDYTITYFPDAAGNVVTLNFTLVDIEATWDFLRVYDGVDTTAPAFTLDLLAPASFRATNGAGAITIRFTSDGSGQPAGWVASYTCAAPPSCLEPSALMATNITDTMASLSWTSGGSGETAWDVEIVPAGTAPTGTPTDAGVTNPFNATGLTAQTDYDYYVRAACSATDFSVFSGPFSFTTQCAPVNAFPVTVDFTNNVPNSCWSEAGMGELAAGPSGLGASDWGQGRAYTNAAGVVVPSNHINLYQSVDREWLISETYDLGTGSYNIAVEVAVTDYAFSGTSTASDTDTMGSDDSVILAIFSDNGGTWVPLTTWNVGNQPAVTGTEFFASLSSYSGLVQFAFLASDGTVDDSEDYDFHVGSFRIETTAGTSDTALAASLRLYPNPVNGDELNIAFDQSTQETVNVTIVNMTGQVIRTERFDQVSNSVTLNNMNRLATGVYFVNITQGTQAATLKFIKQ